MKYHGKHRLETMPADRIQPVWAIYTRLGYTTDCYPTRHAISDIDQAFADALDGAREAIA